MISETQTQSVEVPTVEKKKRNYKKKEPKAVETQIETPAETESKAVVSNPKPKRGKNN